VDIDSQEDLLNALMSQSEKKSGSNLNTGFV